MSSEEYYRKPLVSVIIPVYNVAEYLAECIESLIKQTYSNIEIILVDDKSTDDSHLICDAYGQNDSRIVTIHQPSNQGVSAARNKGIQISRGDYICFVDSDDWVSPDYIFQLLTSAIDNASDLTTVGLINYYSPDNIVPDTNPINFLNDLNNPEQLHTLIKTKNLPGPVCKLYRKEFIATNDILFSIDIGFAEDKEFNAKYISHCKSAFVSDYCGYYYRRTVSGSLSKKIHKERYVTEYRIWTIWYESLKQRKCHSKELDKYFVHDLYYITLDSIIGSRIDGYTIPNLNQESFKYLRRNFFLIDETNILRKYLLVFGCFRLIVFISNLHHG